MYDIHTYTHAHSLLMISRIVCDRECIHALLNKNPETDYD